MSRKLDPCKRDAILGAARGIFKERSFTETTVSQIARRAGIATGTFYLYFRSKLEVVDALCDYYLMGQIRQIAAGIDDHDAAKSIDHAVHAGLAYASENADLVRLIDLRRSNIGVGSRPGADRDVQKTVRTWLGDFVNIGAIHAYNPRILAEIITGMIEWISKVCFAWSELDPHRYEDTVTEMLRRALIIDYKG